MLIRKHASRAMGLALAIAVGTLGDRVEAASFEVIHHGSATATGVSADGSVVVGVAGLGSGFPNAFRWTAQAGPVDLGTLDLAGVQGWSIGGGVSGDGAVVVGQARSGASSSSGFRWTAQSGMVAIPGEGGALEASFDGSVVVGRQDFPSNDNQAYRWTADSGVVLLGDLPGGDLESLASDVSDDGSVVVGFSVSDSGIEAFRWTANTGMVGLGDLPGGRFDSEARAISADGSVIVGFGATEASGFGEEAFRWTQETGMVSLGDLPGGDFESLALDVSADGSVVVGSSRSDAGEEATIWDQTHGLRSLTEVLTQAGVDLGGWRLLDARGVSADGRTIIGRATDINSQVVAWVAVIPEPGTLGTLAPVGLACLLRAQRRR